jgi:hypothetical protein
MNHIRNLTARCILSSSLVVSSSSCLATDDEWEFMVAPLFLWGISLEGEAALEGNVVGMDLDFQDDIFENLDGALTLHFEARKNDWLFFAEYQYVSLNPGFEAALGPISVNPSIEFDVTTAELGAGYTVSHNDRTRWEVLGGLRLVDHELDVDVNGPEFLPSTISGGDDWSHGFLGARVITAMDEKWSFVARGDYGYGGSDNKAIHLSAMVDYRFRHWGSAFFGYRYLDMTYSGGSYDYDAAQQGPQLGVSIWW